MKFLRTRLRRYVGKPIRAFLGAAVVLAAAEASAVTQSVARAWNEQALGAIRIDLPRPPVHARNLFHLSVAMYDAWAAYDTTASGFLFTEKITPTQDVELARAEAISFAAFRVLSARYSLSVNSNTSLAAFSNQMAALGYDAGFTATNGTTAAAAGNRIAAAVLAFGRGDGANESNNYSSAYVPTNPPLIVSIAGATNLVDANRWQPLALDFSVTQNGIEAGKIQTNVCPHWGAVSPFALMRFSATNIYEDRGSPPRLGGATDTQFKQEMAGVVEMSGQLTPDDGALLDISPGAFGNNSVGMNDGTGHPTNPATGQPYETNIVKRGDFGRVLAEFWADGPNSETPPGHWNALANYVSDSTQTVKQIGGAGPVLGDLEWDVKLYFGLNGALHDAAIAAWNHKGTYDSIRPISAIRYMGALGQSSDPFQPSFHTNGLPLVPGLIELVTTNSVQPGQPHTNLSSIIGHIVVRTWPGQPANPTSQYSGVKWIRAAAWLPYQKNTFVTPPFPGMISGHSTFSRSAAEFLTSFTGSAYFPGGLGEFVAPSNTFLTFERGPSQTVRLQWATFFDAADQAGISRLWGGIHIAADDREGRRAGVRIGQNSYQLALQYFAGHPEPHPPFDIAAATAPDGDVIVKWPTRAGRRYTVQTGTNLQNFADASVTYTSTATSITWTNLNGSQPLEFFRVRTGAP